MLCDVVSCKLADVSGVFIVSIIRAMRRQWELLKRRSVSTTLHGSTSQKTTVFTLATVRTEI